MYRRKRTTTLVLIFLMLFGAMIFVLWSTQTSRADGPPDDPSVTDPCFRTDPECYEPRQVECDNNVFVPMNSDGTWECPVQEQLPEEQIGRSEDCPDGQIGYVTDVEGHVRCLPPPDQVSRGGSHPYFYWDFIIRLVQIMLGLA
jgi:hypothetical protein